MGKEIFIAKAEVEREALDEGGLCRVMFKLSSFVDEVENVKTGEIIKSGWPVDDTLHVGSAFMARLHGGNKRAAIN